MKHKLILAALLSALVGNVFAAQNASPSKQGKQTQDDAVKMTQVLTLSLCKDKGNVDKDVIVAKSMVFKALVPMVSMGVTPDGFAKHRSQLTALLETAKCDDQGVLQLH